MKRQLIGRTVGEVYGAGGALDARCRCVPDRRRCHGVLARRLNHSRGTPGCGQGVPGRLLDGGLPDLQLRVQHVPALETEAPVVSHV